MRSRRRGNDVVVSVGHAISELPERDDPEYTLARRELLSKRLTRTKDEGLLLLYRRYCLGENSTDIAAELKQSPAAVRMRLKRLRSALAAAAGAQRVARVERQVPRRS
jgi:DNA-directed RNA polymerase specialized sigma24 family protein